MRILFIPSADIVTKSGGAFANRAFYDSLVRHYPDCVDVIPYHMKGGKVKSFLHGKIHRLYYWLLDYLDERKGLYQVCVINTGLFGDLIPEIRKRGIRVVTIHHNFEDVFQVDSKSPITLWGLTSSLVRKNEKMAYQYSDLNVFLSAYDRDMMRTHYGVMRSQHDEVVGVYETSEQSKTSLKAVMGKAETTDVAISGSLYHVQTVQGIKDFEENYYDLFRQIIPSSRLMITGRGPGKAMKAFASRKGAVLVPNPDSISETLKDCSIYLCPVNVGSGVKFRILDGLRLGMPILTHAVSARGYEVFADKPWFKSYHDAESFERGLRSLLQYMHGKADFRSEIIQDYLSFFSFEAGDRRFIDIFSKMI